MAFSMKPFLFVLLVLLSVEARVLRQDDSYVQLSLGNGLFRLILDELRRDLPIPATISVSYKISMPHFVIFYEDPACDENAPGGQFPIMPSSLRPTLQNDNVPLPFEATCVHTGTNPLEALKTQWDRIGDADADAASKEYGHIDLSEPDILDTEISSEASFARILPSEIEVH